MKKKLALIFVALTAFASSGFADLPPTSSFTEEGYLFHAWNQPMTVEYEVSKTSKNKKAVEHRGYFRFLGQGAQVLFEQMKKPVTVEKKKITPGAPSMARIQTVKKGKNITCSQWIMIHESNRELYFCESKLNPLTGEIKN